MPGEGKRATDGYELNSPGPNNAVANPYFYSGGDNVDGKWFRDYDDISSDTHKGAIPRTAEGQYTLTLKQRWRKIYAHAQAMSATVNDRAKVVSITDGYAAENVIVIQTEAGGAASELAANKKINLTLVLKR